MSTTTTAPGRLHKGVPSLFTDPFDEHRSVQVDQTCFMCQREVVRKQRFRLELEDYTWHEYGSALVALYFDGRDIDTFQKVDQHLLYSRRRNDGELSLSGHRRHVIFKNIIPLESHTTCGRCFPSHAVYLTHRQCWETAQSVVPGQLARLMRFAIATRALFPPPRGYPSQDLLGFHGVGEWAGDTDLGSLLRMCEDRLPTELQNLVLQMVAGSSFWHVLHARIQAIPLIMKADRHNLDLDPLHVPIRGHEDDGVVKTLSATFETIFFVDYISDLKFNTPGRSTMTIPVRNEETIGISYAVSKHGLRGLKIMYADGTESEWLGSTAGCYFGSAYGIDLEQLVMLKSVFTVMRVAFGVSNLLSENDKIVNGRKVIHPLWDRPIFFPPGQTHHFRPLSSGSLSIMIPYYTNFRLFHHLPLEYPTGYAHGITVWNDRTGKCGISVHPPTGLPYTIGTKDGIATHFPLAPDEFLTGVWIRESGSAGSSPVVSLSTSRKSRVNFAPHMYCTVARGDRAHFFTEGWTAVSPAGRKVTSLFLHASDRLDAPVVAEPKLPKELGAITHPTTKDLPYVLPRADPPVITTLPLHNEASGHSIFVSSASLLDVTTVDLRRRGPRVLGLCLTYKDGLRKTLGQWVPPDTDLGTGSIRHGRIYNASKPEEKKWVFAGLDVHVQPLDKPLSSGSGMRVVGRVDVVRREVGQTSKVQVWDAVSTKVAGTEIKRFRGEKDKCVVWWYGFAGDEVVEGTRKELEGQEVSVEVTGGRVVL